LVRAYIIREIVLESAELIRAIITHPGATRSRRHGELNTAIYVGDTDMRVIFVSGMNHVSSKKSKKGKEEKTNHV